LLVDITGGHEKRHQVPELSSESVYLTRMACRVSVLHKLSLRYHRSFTLLFFLFLLDFRVLIS